MRRQERSRLTIRQFCHQSNLAETAFHYWRRELKRRDAEPAGGLQQGGHAQEQRRGRGHPLLSPDRRHAPTFVPVRLAARRIQPRVQEVGAGGSGRIEIILSGGRRVHVFAPVDRQALADVLAVLAATSPEPRPGHGRGRAGPEKEDRPC
jgi:hypothetical protein